MKYRVEYLVDDKEWYVDSWFLTAEEALNYAVKEATATTSWTHRVVEDNPKVLAEIKPMGGIEND